MFRQHYMEGCFPNVSNSQLTAVWLANFGSRLFLYIYFPLPKSLFYLYLSQNGLRQLIITLSKLLKISQTSANTNQGFWTKKEGSLCKW